MLKIKNFNPRSISRVDPDLRGNSCESNNRGNSCEDSKGHGCADNDMTRLGCKDNIFVSLRC